MDTSQNMMQIQSTLAQPDLENTHKESPKLKGDLISENLNSGVHTKLIKLAMEEGSSDSPNNLTEVCKHHHIIRVCCKRKISFSHRVDITLFLDLEKLTGPSPCNTTLEKFNSLINKFQCEEGFNLQVCRRHELEVTPEVTFCDALKNDGGETDREGYVLVCNFSQFAVKTLGLKKFAQLDCCSLTNVFEKKFLACFSVITRTLRAFEVAMKIGDAEGEESDSDGDDFFSEGAMADLAL